MDFRVFQAQTDAKPPPPWKERNILAPPGQIPELYDDDLYQL